MREQGGWEASRGEGDYELWKQEEEEEEEKENEEEEEEEEEVGKMNQAEEEGHKQAKEEESVGVQCPPNQGFTFTCLATGDGVDPDI